MLSARVDNSSKSTATPARTQAGLELVRTNSARETQIPYQKKCMFEANRDTSYTRNNTELRLSPRGGAIGAILQALTTELSASLRGRCARSQDCFVNT